jgi:hypothetical protein
MSVLTCTLFLVVVAPSLFAHARAHRLVGSRGRPSPSLAGVPFRMLPLLPSIPLQGLTSPLTERPFRLARHPQLPHRAQHRARRRPRGKPTTPPFFAVFRMTDERCSCRSSRSSATSRSTSTTSLARSRRWTRAWASCAPRRGACASPLRPTLYRTPCFRIMPAAMVPRPWDFAEPPPASADEPTSLPSGGSVPQEKKRVPTTKPSNAPTQPPLRLLQPGTGIPTSVAKAKAGGQD